MTLALAAVAMLAPHVANAGLLGDRVEVGMYGRVGVAWSLTGQQLQGVSLNLNGMGAGLGGRFEEGDYLEPTIKFHILKPADEDMATKPWVQAVLTPAIFTRNGSFLSAFANGFAPTLGTEIFQAYLAAGNVFLPGLEVWAGSRFHRGGDVHIADYFYFNNLTGQGAGVKYKGLDVAVLLHTNPGATRPDQYNYDVDLNGTIGPGDLRRQRTVLVGQYVYNLGDTGHHIHGLAEIHALPAFRTITGNQLQSGEIGWALGVKGHLSLEKMSAGSFNDLSIRFGSGAANGSRGAAQTWNTFGLPNTNGQHDGAAGLEVVDHFLYNVNKLLTVNAYGILHWNQGASRTDADKALDFAAGVRTFLYFHDNFHLINELTFQGLQNGTSPMGTALKFSIVPTIVPSGERSAWARPHLRFIYSLAVYNQAAVDARMSPYLGLFGAQTVGHFLGSRVEWWF